MRSRPEARASEESTAAGKAARLALRRSEHARWKPGPDRIDPVKALTRQAQRRTPELVPIRNGRMAASPFAFFRGGAALMAGDLANTPVAGLRVQLCGDAHLANFGVFAAPDRSLVFDVNDFDETVPGPWEWDLKRLAASFAVAGRDGGFDADVRRDFILEAARAYREAMRSFASMRTIDVWYARMDVERQLASWSKTLGAKGRKRLNKAVAKAREKDSLRALAKLTNVVDGEPRISSDPPLLVPVDELLKPREAGRARNRVFGQVRAYENTLPHDRRHLLAGYRPVDVARKVVGVGSVGTRCWIVLLLGADATDPLVLQVKEAERSALEPFLGRRRSANQGQRVVEGQQLMQAASDIFLGWLRVDKDIDGKRRDYYVRQLWDAKASAPIETMTRKGLSTYAGACGWTLARAHARSGDRFAIAGYLGSGDAFDNALAAFAERYADQNERDFDAFAAAVKAGRVPADLNA